MSETLTWTRDEQAQAYICSDGRVVTDEMLNNMDPFGAGMLKQVLDESAPSPTRVRR